jgi:hypothetical protein
VSRKTPTQTTPAYSLGEQVRVTLTGEVGEVTQVCLNATREPNYRVKVTLLGNLGAVFRAVTEADIEAAQ